MGDKRMKNIYQKLHQACLNAGGVKKGEKVKGMHFNPLLHDAVQEVAVQALLDERLYPMCSYKTDTHDSFVMVTCYMRIHDVDSDDVVEMNGCSAMGGLDKFGTGQAMSYARKYAFLNALNLKTGLDLEDGYNATPFKKNSTEKSVEANPQYADDNVDVEEIKGQIKDTKTIEQFNLVRSKYKDQIQYLIKNNLRAYRQVSDIAETHSIKLNSNGQR